MITQTISAKGSSKISAINKKKELISKIKAILKSRNVAFRSTPPSDWKEKSRTFAIFFPEKKVVFTLGVVNKLKIEDGWINHKISDTEDAVLSVGKIINLIEDSQHG